MPQSPPNGMPRIAPNVFYDDPAQALEWLGKAFGFEKRMALPGPDGGIMHAEMQVADSCIMMSPAASTEEWKSPKSLGGSVTMSLYVYVDDVDAHFTHAKAAGATILSEPEDHPPNPAAVQRIGREEGDRGQGRQNQSIQGLLRRRGRESSS